MRYIKVIIFLFLFISPCFGSDEVQKLFEAGVSTPMKFTKVPRGLIVSFNEEIFFNDGVEKIRENSTCVLNQIADILNKTGKVCVVEGHTENVRPEISCYKSNWELSLARANNITLYLMRCANVDPEKLFSIGYGEFMPLDERVNSRIDFVILDYEKNLGDN